MLPVSHSPCQQSSCLLVALLSCLHCVLLQDEAKYVIFDGDVDAVWVENMNSVMDDNKLLTLPNGERIRLQPHCRLLFEVCSIIACIQSAGFLQHLLTIQVNQPPVGVLHLTTQSAHRRCLAVQVGDLQYASPATISRCGMVFVDSLNLGYMPYIQTWLASR